jgi:diacylglycerol O-acyltransferase
MYQLNPLDTAFLLAENTKTPTHVTMISIYDPATCPGKPPTFEDIVEAVRVGLPVAPTFRRKIVRVPLDLDYPYWVEDEDFDLDYHMRHMGLPKPGTWKQFRAQASRLVSRPLDMTRPPWEMTVIEGLDNIEGLPSGCFATVLKIHHCAIDGQSGLAMVSALHQNSPGAKPKKIKDTWKPEPVPGNRELMGRAWINGFRRPLAIARLLLANSSTLVRAAFDEMRSDEDKVKDSDRVVPQMSFNAPVTAQRIFDDVTCSLADLKLVRKAVDGVTINDVCLTIVAEGLRRYLVAKGELPVESLVTSVPISTRTPEQAEGGNQLSATIIALRTDIADPMERLAAIAQETRQKKAVQSGVVMSVLLDVVQNLPGALVGTAMRAFPLMLSTAKVFCNTMVTNVPGPMEPLYLLGAEMKYSTGCPPLFDGNGLLHSVSSYNGEFLFSFTTCPELMPDVDFYRECLDTAVKEVIKAAGGGASRPHSRGRARKS